MTNEKTRAVPKSKNHMYEQQLEHLPTKDLDGLTDAVKAMKPKRWALITHDRDVRPDGQAVKPHVHVMMTFENARSPRAIAKALGDKPQYVQAWRGDSRNGYAYLVHRTDGARAKFQYSPAEVIASFDYEAELVKYEKGSAAARTTAAMPNLLDALYRGDISRDELTAQLTGSQIAKNARAIDAVMSEKLRREAIEWRKEMKEQNKTVEVIWLFGGAGTGKSSFAKAVAEKLAGEKGYFISGSSRGVFEGYDGEHVIILDELVPALIPYSDLKRITDPYGEAVRAPSRYRDVYLMAETVIVTSPFSPINLYAHQVNHSTDTFDQLARRLTSVVRTLPDVMQLMTYNPARQRYDVEGEEWVNKFSSAARTPATRDAASAFSSLYELTA